MNDLFAGLLGSIQTFNLQNFMSSLQWVFFAVYFLFSFYLAVKTYRDAGKRFKDKLLVICITVLVFAFNVVGYIIYSMFKPKDLIREQQMFNMEKYFLEYETRGIGKCKVCKHVYFPEHTYCVNCGTLVRTKCSLCANTIELDWKVCPFCGDKKKFEYNDKHTLTTSSVKGIEVNKT